jgi:hypothetical protein
MDKNGAIVVGETINSVKVTDFVSLCNLWSFWNNFVLG